MIGAAPRDPRALPERHEDVPITRDEKGPLAHPAVSWAIAAFLFGSVAAWVSASSTHVGFAWAENDYLDHMDRIVEWSKRIEEVGLRRGIDVLTAPYWESRRYWNPHPPLFKYQGLLGRKAWPALGFPRAERLPSALLLGATCAGVFLWLRRSRGPAAALFGAVAVGTMPRLFGHAMFCTPELSLVAGWFFASLAHERWESTGRKVWLLALAAAFILGLGSKVSAVLMLVPLAALTLFRRYRRGPAAVARGAASLALVLAVGLAALIVLYPYLWPDPAGRLAGLVQEAREWSKHNAFTALFFGRVVPYPLLPWYFAPVILFLVVPPLVLLLAVWGAAFDRKRDAVWLSAVVQVAFWILLMAAPGTPKYDNERQMVPIFPFLGVLAGTGFDDLFARAGRFLRGPLAGRLEIAASLVASLAMALSVAAALPFPLSYYSPAVGGIRGATRLGFEATYLMEALSPEVLKRFEEKLPSGAGITILPAADFGPFLRRRGYLRPDLDVPPRGSGPYYLVVDRHHQPGDVQAVVQTTGRLIDAYAEDDVLLVGLWYLASGSNAEHPR